MTDVRSPTLSPVEFVSDDIGMISHRFAGVFFCDRLLFSLITEEPVTCSNGIIGVEAYGQCCVVACGTCGGSGCWKRAVAAGLSPNDCCVSRIQAAEVFCNDSETAPCTIGTLWQLRAVLRIPYPHYLSRALSTLRAPSPLY